MKIRVVLVAGFGYRLMFGVCEFGGGFAGGCGSPSYGQDVNAAQGLRKLTSSERPNWRAMISL